MGIKVEGLSYSYGRGSRNVISDIDLDFEKPGLYCIIGPNGVGKSTLVKCINRILEPTRGKVYINGRDSSEMKRKEIAEYIAYVPVATQDMFSMSVLDAVLIGRHNHQTWRNTVADIEIAYRTLELLGISDLAERQFDELSAGQHQKVVIARGLVQETPAMILDEPTSNLDVRHQMYVTELLRDIANKKGMIIVMICHDLNISAKYAHEVIVMKEPGEIMCVGTPEKVFDESLMKEVYGIDCKVTEDMGRPHVILRSALPPKRPARRQRPRPLIG